MDKLGRWEEFKQLAEAALVARRRLLDFLTSHNIVDCVDMADAEDLEWIVQLVSASVQPALGMELLVRVSKTVAEKVVLQRYLGPQVDALTRFGGPASDLEAFVAAYARVHGEDALRQFLLSPAIADARRAEAWVVISIELGLNVDQAAARAFLGLQPRRT